ncbi:MAG: hypothetical protein A2015_14330 [Spirochaetes bacterium GWF1_31_7]|nr:MAG: hypothetical protein A2Y30_03420 [Spirochaetes bacterium GWE1_32_154]OHD45455.1 MAG: hypothetical protein A2Y29_01400 [Spirochaetes bacterium GWE2_31_10]OHD50578.1 MAG: hypothetical protein A2015_14330 [Spirochaetes bacterium GWF1_31_7]OHD81556.1 MAG: hypothetical protein A2355_02400 [Spirochaetes bacterium RIFOXYB1_FULL_32_8]HBD94568.1 hypothetical protein [Spirochaetia bacterium]
MFELDRLLFIDRKIRYNGKVTTKQIIDEFGVSERTVRNDIAYMKEMRNIPVEYSREKGGYHYFSKYEFIIYTNEKLVLTFTFLKAIIHTMNYVPFISEELEKAFMQYLPTGYKNLFDKVEYELSQFEKISPDKMMFVFESFKTSKKISIEYTNQQDETRRLVVEPLKLVNYLGNWYLIAHMTHLDTLSVFNFSRITDILLTEYDFENKIDAVSLKQTLGNNFGIFKGANESGRSEFVVIRFYGIARTITKNQVFHPKQEITNGVDAKRGEYIEFKLSVRHYDELLGRVLQYGVHGEVISPPKFKEKWLTAIKEMADIYLNGN